jgi:uncharacterized membrane protein (DUF106 family)
MAFWDPIMGFLMGWSLPLNPLVAVTIITLLISVMVVLIYKFTTNQSLMKQLKDEMKSLQADMKQLRDKPEQALEVQKKAMEANMKYMMQSFRATFFTLIPIILIFGYMNAHWAFEPTHANEEFTVDILAKQSGTVVTAFPPPGIQITSEPEKSITDGKAIFTFKATQEGTQVIVFKADDNAYNVTVYVGNERRYEPVNQAFKYGPVSQATVGLKKLIVLNLFGWQLGWLGTYILLSIVFSMILRKLLKIY